jgi:hypothetical protein
MRGYVWQGGFTMNRVTLWANGMRAMGTGHIWADAVLTRIDFRVALGRYTAYGLAVFGAIFLAVAALGVIAMWMRGRTEPILLMFVVFAIALPLALAITAGRMPRQDHKRSEEADRLLAFVYEVVGAEPRPSRPAIKE